ncbi:MAG: glycosyltransferase family 2 protein [Planctomycetota bacterium]
MQKISVIVPCRDEQAVLADLHARLHAVFEALPDLDAEFLFVNDGSRDATLDVARALRRIDPRVGIVDLARGFGKEIAMTAGLDHATGDAVVFIDADLQDPPEVIAEFVAWWRRGFDVVYGVRTDRGYEPAWKRWAARLFYRHLDRVSRVSVPQDTGDFRLLSRRAADALRANRERHRFMKGLFAWIGFEQKGVPYERPSRARGETKFGFGRLWNLALDGITSMSVSPLRFALYTGAVSTVLGLGFLLFALAGANPVLGAVLFLGGVQLVSLGVLGEYVGRTYHESKQRPLYVEAGFAAPATRPAVPYPDSVARPDPTPV